MASTRDFWSQDRTTIHKKSGWFERLPLLRRISYVLLLIFIISWCFYLGMTFAAAIAPEYEGEILYGSDWQGSEGMSDIDITDLEGVEVALLVGADKRPGEKTYRTDTIILAFFNWGENTLKLLSVPRDSYVQLPGTSTKTKINEAYFYGGIPLLENTIEYTFGIKVNHFVEMDFAAFVKVIDVFGGVDIDVKYNMRKVEEDINIKKGQQTLMGHDALGFVRFRDLPMGDIDRIANQQIFIRALATKIASGLNIWKAPQLVNIAMEYTRTDFPLSEALTMGSAVLKSDLNNIGMYTLPGDGLYLNGGSYWFLNKQGCASIIAEISGGEAGDLHILDSGGRATATPTAKPKPAEEEPPQTEENPGEDISAEETPPAENPPEAPEGIPEENPPETPVTESEPDSIIEQNLDIPVPQSEQPPGDEGVR